MAKSRGLVTFDCPATIFRFFQLFQENSAVDEPEKLAVDEPKTEL